MFLNYLSLAMIVCSVTAIFYLLIYIHELPYEAAKHRNHPQRDAIYIACWISLFTLHALWPLIFIWALSHNEKEALEDEVNDWEHRVAGLEARLALLEGKGPGQAMGAAKGGKS